MLIILLPKCTQECVVNAIDSLTETIGLHCFRKHFPVILTDNGSEFKNPQGIEKTKDGKHRTYVFYCDPYVSNQKADWRRIMNISDTSSLKVKVCTVLPRKTSI